MKDTALPASSSTTLPDPYSHGYMYGSSSFALVDEEYPPDVQAAAKAGTLQPNDYTSQNPSYASVAGGVFSTANDLLTWIQALVGGRCSTRTIRTSGSTACSPRILGNLTAQQYGYGIAQLRFGPNIVYFHGGEMSGYNSFMGYDPANRLALVVWTNLTVAPDGKPTANSIMLKVLDQVYVESPLRPAQTPTPP